MSTLGLCRSKGDTLLKFPSLFILVLLLLLSLSLLLSIQFIHSYQISSTRRVKFRNFPHSRRIDSSSSSSSSYGSKQQLDGPRFHPNRRECCRSVRNRYARRLSITAGRSLSSNTDDDESTASLSQNSNESNEEDDNTNNDIVQIMKASLLIAGTTVGGGFLAVPQSILIPLGGQFIPAIISLIVVWFFLFLQSIYLSEAIIKTRTMFDNNKNTLSTTTSEKTIGIAACVQRNLDDGSNDKSKTNAKWASSITIILLFLLTEATLVSQLSRAGT